MLTMLPPFTWVTINHYINHKVVLFPIFNDGPWLDMNRRPLDLHSLALPSKLLAIDFVNYFVVITPKIRNKELNAFQILKL